MANWSFNDKTNLTNTYIVTDAYLLSVVQDHLKSRKHIIEAS